MLTPPPFIRGLSEVFGRYEGFILDLWGVVHDGVAPFPDTIPALSSIKKSGRKIWLLSNAPRRASVIIEKLTEMGIPRGLYDGIVTSGEASWQALQESLLGEWGRRCIHIGSSVRDRSLYEGLDIKLVTDPLHADFVLNSGIEDFSDTLEKYIPLLEKCRAQNLPMLCANPDKTVHVKEQLVICAGALAAAYEAMGGQVVYYGKPYRSVYSRCLREMEHSQVLAVGDSMLTDIAGATGVGLDSVLVTLGIHREELVGEGPFESFLARYPYQPTYIMRSFTW